VRTAIAGKMDHRLVAVCSKTRWRVLAVCMHNVHSLCNHCHIAAVTSVCHGTNSGICPGTFLNMPQSGK
jgi:hypothetical protein